MQDFLQIVAFKHLMIIDLID